MVKLNVLIPSPFSRWASNTHPYYRWRNQFKKNGIKLHLFFNHNDKGLRDADHLIIHSRYFATGWQNISKRTEQNQAELAHFLTQVKKSIGKIIWFDEADSSGSSDFPIIPYVDVFAKKQLLKDTSYYTLQNGDNDLRIWLNSLQRTKPTLFEPCPVEHLHKLRVAWNLGTVDYRYYPKRFNKLSNFLSYKLYYPRITKVEAERDLDLGFRGSIKYDDGSMISHQRNVVLKILKELNLKVVAGQGRVHKLQYLKELSRSKVSISPFGFGEICYRDFEIFNAGSLLIKPSMEHISTYPDVYLPNKTYIPVSWDLSDLEEKLKESLSNYSTVKHIATSGQENFLKIINDPEFLVKRVNALIE